MMDYWVINQAVDLKFFIASRDKQCRMGSACDIVATTNKEVSHAQIHKAPTESTADAANH
jgi:hypothetical protein